MKPPWTTKRTGCGRASGWVNMWRFGENGALRVKGSSHPFPMPCPTYLAVPELYLFIKKLVIWWINVFPWVLWTTLANNRTQGGGCGKLWSAVSQKHRWHLGLCLVSQVCGVGQSGRAELLTYGIWCCLWVDQVNGVWIELNWIEL